MGALPVGDGVPGSSFMAANVRPTAERMVLPSWYEHEPVLHAPRPDQPGGHSVEHGRLLGVSEDRRTLGPPARVHDLRGNRLLRQLAEPARDQARARYRAPDRALTRAGRELVLLLPGRLPVQLGLSEVSRARSRSRGFAAPGRSPSVGSPPPATSAPSPVALRTRTSSKVRSA